MLKPEHRFTMKNKTSLFQVFVEQILLKRKAC